MKRILRAVSSVFFLLLLCPFVMGAISTHQPYQPQANGNPQVKNSQTLNLTNSMFGLNGPFAVSLQYSQDYGLYLTGKLTQAINKANAAALELSLGKNQRRINATYGLALTPKQRVKVTAENLSQRMDFDFAAGKTTKWIYQNAFGLGYQYLISHSFFHDINANTFYSRSVSRSLDSRAFSQSGIGYLDYRHIAGATDKSASAGVDVTPRFGTLVGAQLNYDDVYYNMRYESSNNDSGLGATLSLNQVVTKHVKFNLLASDRKPYQSYKGEVDWLLNSAPGSTLQVGLLGQRIIGNLGLKNDNRFGLELSYAWGGSSDGHPTVYSGELANNSMGDLAAWTGQPAVHMDQVLAVKDEKVTQTSSSASPPSFKAGVSSAAIVKIAPKESIHINVMKQLKVVGLTENGKTTLTARDLPKGHDLQFKDGRLIVNKDSFSQADIGKHYTLHFVPSASSSSQMKSDMQSSAQIAVGIPLVLAVVGADIRAPYPNSNQSARPQDHTVSVNHPVTEVYGAKPSNGDDPNDTQVFINPAEADLRNPLQIAVDGLPQGLTSSVTHFTSSDGHLMFATLTISGTPTTPGGPHLITVTATNKYGSSSVTYHITVSGHLPTPPTVTMHSESHYPHAFQVGTDLNSYDMADLSTDFGELDMSDATINGDPLGDSGWTAHGIHAKYVPGEKGPKGVTTGKIELYGTPTDATFSSETLTLSGVKNTEGKVAPDATFTLDVAGAPIPDTSKTIPPQSIAQGNSGEIADVGQYFKNPTQSGTINKFTADAPTGITVTGGDAGTKATIDVASTVAAGEHDVKFYAKNELNLTAKTAQILKLTVTATSAPTVTVNSEPSYTKDNNQAFNVNSPISNYDMADLTANAGDLDMSEAKINGTSLADWSAHGIKASYEPGSTGADGVTTGKILLNDQPSSATFAKETLTISGIKNSKGKVAPNETFELSVGGAPKPNSTAIPDKSVAQGGQGEVADISQYFDNPTDSGPIDGFTVGTLPTGITVTGGDAGTQATINVATTVATGDYDVNFYAKNELGSTSATVQTLKLTVTPAGAPTVTVHSEPSYTKDNNQAFNVNSPISNYDMADLTANAGDLDMSGATINGTSLADWSAHGITASYEPGSTGADGVTTGKIVLNGQSMSATFAKETLTISGIKNSAGQVAPDATFDLSIGGGPKPNSTAIPNQSITQGGQGEVADISQYFDNPTDSGPIDGFTADAPTGITVIGGDSGTKATIDVASTVTTGEYDVSFYAKNELGFTSSATQTLKLTVTDGAKPTVTIHPESTDPASAFKEGDTSLDFKIADIVANTGDVDLSTASVNGEDLADWSEHGMTIVPKETMTTVYRDGHLVKLPTEALYLVADTVSDPTFASETLKLTGIKNTAGKEALEADFDLNVGGKPQNNSDEPFTPQTVKEGGSITPIDLTTTPYFKNPTVSGDMTYALGTQPTGFHLTIQNNQIEGSVDTDTTPDTYHIDVTATNDDGTSTAKQLDVTVEKIVIFTAACPDPATFTYDGTGGVTATITDSQGHNTYDLHLASGKIFGPPPADHPFALYPSSVSYNNNELSCTYYSDAVGLMAMVNYSDKDPIPPSGYTWNGFKNGDQYDKNVCNNSTCEFEYQK